jgi:hypothetical protein
VRKSIALILAAGLLATLSACSASGSIDGCTPLAAPGASSDTIKVDGKIHSATPTVTFGVPLNAPKTQRSVLIDGSGDPANANDVIQGTATILDGSSGEVAQQGQFLLTLSKAQPAGLIDSLQCAREGDRIAAAIPNAEMSADATAASSPAGPTGVIVFDIDKVYPGRANGGDQPVQDGFPSVVTTPDTGQPGITIPAGSAPDKLKFTTLKKGDGTKVAAGDAVLVQYTGLDWASKTVFDSTWNDGAAKIIGIAPTAQQGDGGIVPGLVTALTGQTVGSQVLAVIPPDQGFGDAGNGGTVAAGATLVYVVDILGVVPVPAQ